MLDLKSMSLSLMALFSALTAVLLPWRSFASAETHVQPIKSARLLDLYIRDYAVNSFDKHFRIKTGSSHNVKLPSNFSGIRVDTARFRCGSLRRYGAKLNEFSIGTGATVHPCVERVMVITQNLGYDWFSVYYSNYDLSGYRIVSPILSLLAYNDESDMNLINPFEVGILAGEKPITVDFSNSTRVSNISGTSPYCASFEGGGKVTLAKQVSPYVCSATRHGHFGLVVAEAPPDPVKKRERQWKVVVGSSIGAGLGAFLIGLLMVAMFVRVKKRSAMAELERRAYEEEALQVSMVGHVRAPTASVTRTTPSVEHNYIPPH